MIKILDFLTSEKSTSFIKNDIIFKENDECDYVGFIKNGSVKIVSYTNNGTEVIYNIIKKGEIFGANLIFSSNPIYRGDVQAIEDCEIYLLSKDQLLSLMTNNKEFLLMFLEIQSDFSKQLNLNIKLLTFKSAEEKVMYFLDLNHGIIKIKTISSLANTLFLSRESLSRTLHKLQKTNIINIQNKIIIKQN